MGVAAKAQTGWTGFKENICRLSDRDWIGPWSERDFDGRALCAQCESALTKVSDFVDIRKWDYLTHSEVGTTVR